MNVLVLEELVSPGILSGLIPPAQTQDILDSRLSEELNTSLSISVYDVARNETARQHRQELVSLRHCACGCVCLVLVYCTGSSAVE